MPNTLRTAEDVREVGAISRKLPKEDWFIGKKGYRRTYRPDGTYTWEYRHQPNEDGKVTHAGAESVEMLSPWIEASSNRQARLASKVEHVALRDDEGRVQYVVPERAERTARENGWGHFWRARGNPVERGMDGMLYRMVSGRWEPLGVRCLGTPLAGSAAVSRAGLQRDPDGRPWRFVDGQWQEA